MSYTFLTEHDDAIVSELYDGYTPDAFKAKVDDRYIVVYTVLPQGAMVHFIHDCSRGSTYGRGEATPRAVVQHLAEECFA